MVEDLYQDQEHLQEEGPKVNGQLSVFSVLCEKKNNMTSTFWDIRQGLNTSWGSQPPGSAPRIFSVCLVVIPKKNKKISVTVLYVSVMSCNVMYMIVPGSEGGS